MVIPRQRRRVNIPNVTAEQLQKNKGVRALRLCGDIGKLCAHVEKVKKIFKPRVCAWAPQIPILCGVLSTKMIMRSRSLYTKMQKG